MALGSHPPGRSSGFTAVTRSAVTSGEQRPEDLATVAFGQQYVFPSGVGVAVAAPMMQVPPGRGRGTAIVVVRTTVGLEFEAVKFGDPAPSDRVAGGHP